MLDRVKHDVVKVVLTVQVRTPEDVQAVEEAPPMTNVKYQHADYDAALASEPDGGGRAAVAAPPFVRAGRKWDATIRALRIGRKYKQCHGRLA
jgi:preprotein translocase subunit SecA